MKEKKPGFIDSIRGNSFFSAGVGVAALGVGMAMMRTGLQTGILMAQRHLTVSLEIPSKDRSYQWVLQWISAQQAAQQKALAEKHQGSSNLKRSLFTAGGTAARHIGIETQFKQESNGNIITEFNYVPAPGRHWMKFRHWFLQVQRERERGMVDIQSGTPWETVTLTAVGRDRRVFTELLNEAKQLALSKEQGKTVIYTSMGPDWIPFGQPRRRRPLHSVILDQGIAERILADINDFGASAQWYIDRGIPYRRGYLLYGPPGCGKSSFITALAGELKYNICVLNLNERGLTDDRLNHLMSTAPPRSLILLEDVDAAFIKRDPKMDHYSVTFSGLLNALDGVASTEERITFMTTNHLHRLDPALVRPGRVDLKEEIGLASAHQIRLMFLRFYPDHKQLAREFVDVTKGTPLSIADLQGYFMMFKNRPYDALSHAKEHLVKAKEAERQASEQRAALLQAEISLAKARQAEAAAVAAIR